MPKVLSNTTPILSLLKINQLHLLEALYTRVIVPQAVWQEIEAGKDKPFYIDLTTLAWVEIQTVQNIEALTYLTDLDQGEAEVIVLAREIGADLVILDETLGRQFARHFDLRLTGTLGVLLRAKQERHLLQIKPLLEALRQQGVWISERVFQEVLQLAQEQ